MDCAEPAALDQLTPLVLARPVTRPSMTCRGDLSEDRATAFEERQAEVEALQRAVETLGDALGQAPPALAPISTARERGEGAISLIVARVSTPPRLRRGFCLILITFSFLLCCGLCA